MPTQTAQLAACKEMLTFGKGVVGDKLLEGRWAQCWHIHGWKRIQADTAWSPLQLSWEAGEREKRRCSACAPLVGRILRVALKQTAAVWTMGLRWASKCHPHFTDSKEISCHYGLNHAQGGPVLPLTKDSPERFLLEAMLKVRVKRGKKEWRNAVKLLAFAANSTGPGTYVMTHIWQ